MAKDLETTKISTKVAGDTGGGSLAPAEKQGFFDSFFSFENLRSLGLLILLVLAFRWSVASPYHVPTASMEPTIKVGDRLLAWKMSYGFKIPFTDVEVFSWGKPKPGDIIVFRNPKEIDIDYVKRVIGIAGDKLKVVDSVIYRNGQPQTMVSLDDQRDILKDISDNPDGKLLFRESLEGVDHYVIKNSDPARQSFGSLWPRDGEEYIVPPESVFVMGDNRDNSNDSRVWGQVPLSYVKGRAILVLWSWFTDRSLDEFMARFKRFGHVLE